MLGQINRTSENPRRYWRNIPNCFWKWSWCWESKKSNWRYWIFNKGL